MDRSVPFGKYWRRRRLVFSLVPRCQGLWGSQKYTSRSVASVRRLWSASPRPGPRSATCAVPAADAALVSRARPRRWRCPCSQPWRGVGSGTGARPGLRHSCSGADQVAFPVAGMARSSTAAGRSRIEIASLIWPSPSHFKLACRERRIARVALRWASSSFFSTPRVWMNRLR